MILAWLLACARRSDPACDAWVACVEAVDPDGLENAEAIYGDGGSCFAFGEPDECAADCEELLGSAWTRNGDPACDPASAGLEPVMSFAAFLSAFVDRYCKTWERCVPDQPCPVAEPGPTTAAACPDFDPERGEACLNGLWDCREDPPDFFSVDPPAACDTICG